MDDKEKEKSKGVDEMNLAELPVAVAGRGIRKYHREFNLGNGKIIAETLPRLGLPTHKDESYLIGLLALGRKEGFKSRRLYFSPDELLVGLMGKKGNRRYKYLDNALDKMTTAVFSIENTWWDNREKCNMETIERFHLIDRYFLWYKHKDEKHPEDPEAVRDKKCYIEWGGKLWESIQNNFIKRLDTDFVFSLNLPLSQKLFRILDKWFYRKNSKEIALLELKERLGISDYKYPSDIWKKIKPACEELKRRNFLKDYSRKKRVVAFIKNPSFSSDTAQLEIPFLKTEDKLERDVIAYFCKKMGIPGRSPLDTEIEFARSLLDGHKLKDVQFIINFAIEQAKSTNFQMQTLNAIRQYLFDAEAKSERIKKRQEAEKTEREIKRQREVEILQEEAEHKKFDQIFHSLPEEEQNQIKEQAKQNIINAHPGKSRGSLKYSLDDFSIKIEVRKILKTRFKDH